MTERPRTSERKFPVCDVTDKNFAAVFPEFCEVIDDADFIAIDLEFTGTIRRPCVRHCLDTPEMRYHKAREGGVDHAVIQFGVSAFCWQQSLKKHSVASYNFWIFPSSADERRSRYFMCDSSSLSFLVRNGCDFNKLFREGISYLTKFERDEWCEEIRQKYAHKFAALAAAADSALQTGANNNTKSKNQSEFKNGVVGGNDSEKKVSVDLSSGLVMNGDAEDLPDFLKKAVSQIDAFLASDSPDDPKSIELDLETGFKRKQFYDLVLPRYKDVVAARTQQGQYNGNSTAAAAAESVESANQPQPNSAAAGRPHIKIEKCSAADKRKWLEQRQAEELAKVEKHYAFTAVVEKIRESGRPVVLHNGFLDLCLTFHHFIHPLPDSYDDFLNLYQRLWPTLYDTRLMSDITPLRDELSSVSSLGLEKVYEMLGGRNIFKNQLVPRKLTYAATASSSPAIGGKHDEGFSPSSSTANLTKAAAVAKSDLAVDETELRAHMAGYDAFMTGACFVSMLRRICSLSQISPRDRAHLFPVNQWSYAAGQPSSSYNSGHRHSSSVSHPVGDILCRLQNKLFLSRSHDYPYMDLSLPLTPTTPTASPSFLKVPTRKNVFYITFPSEWGLNDIQDRFKQYGRIRVELIDSQSAALILLDGCGGPNDAASASSGQKSSGGPKQLHGEDLLRVFLQERVNSSTDKQCQVMRYHRLMRELVKATLPVTTARLQQKGKFEEFISRQITGATSSTSSSAKPLAQSNTLIAINGSSASLNNLARGSPAKSTSLYPQRFVAAALSKPSSAKNSVGTPQPTASILLQARESDEPDQRLLHPARLHRASSVPRPESADRAKLAAQLQTSSLSSESGTENSSSLTDVLIGLSTPQSVTEPVSRRSGESVASTELAAQNDAEPATARIAATSSAVQNQRLTKRPRLSPPKFRRDAATGASAAGQGSNISTSYAPPPSNPYVSRYKLVRPSGTAPTDNNSNNQEEANSTSLNNETKNSGNTTLTAAGSAVSLSSRGSETDVAKASTAAKHRLRSAATTASPLRGEAAVADAVKTPNNKNDAGIAQSSGAGTVEHNGKAEDGNDDFGEDAVSPKSGLQRIMPVGKSLRRKNSVSLRVSKRKKSTSSQKE